MTLPRAELRRILEKVRRIDVRTRRLAENAIGGRYHSVFRGRGLDFDSVREYVPGDEVRTIDWNVTARAGRPFVKQFREERELTVLLLVDVSASADFGSPSVSKRELAAELASTLALSAVRNEDRVGLVLFSDRIEKYVPPGKGRGHALRLVTEILTCEPAGHGTDLTAALALAGAVTRRRAVMFLISDLQLGGPHGESVRALERAARPVGARHDLVAIEIRDPHERTLPDVGLVTIEDAETGETLHIDTGRRRNRERFARLAAARDAATRRALRRAGADVVEIDTSRPYLPPLLAFFERREKSLR